MDRIPDEELTTQVNDAVGELTAALIMLERLTAQRDALTPEDIQRVKRVAFWNLQEALKLDCTLALPLVGGQFVPRPHGAEC